MVRVSCMTYNHSAFIVDAMNGFCRQQTNFPFVCTIIDDCSTDGEQQVIIKYLQTNFDLGTDSITRIDETNDYKLIVSRHKINKNCFFVVLFLKYNHYKKKAKSPYISEWNHVSKYYAICEGDDYWTDPLKLQRHVDFLERHQEFTMTCNRSLLYSVNKSKIVGETFCYKKDSVVEVKDVIYRGGLFISTCSIVYRKEIKNDYPDYCKKSPVGDYPLQIMAAMKGKIYYFNDIMSVYRIDNSDSWMGKQLWFTIDEQNLIRIKKMINMFKGFSDDYPRYKKNFSNKIAQYLIKQSPGRYSNQGKDIKYYLLFFKKEYEELPLVWKIIHKLSLTNIPILRGYYGSYTRPIFNQFKEKVLIYK